MTWKHSMAFLAFCVACATHADDRFASSVVNFSNLGTSPYGDPNAVLGKPTTWIKDTINGGPNQRVAVSVNYGAWGTDPLGNPLITTVKTGGYLTVKFDTPITNDPSHWYGMDFIVYGNSFLSGSQSVTYNSNMENISIVSSGVFAEPTPVSVSPDGINWYTYTTPTADNLWPTQPFQWDRTTKAWGAESDWTKPVDPSLSANGLVGKSVADVIDLYKGSAGGTAFDLSQSGFSSISYIRFTGTGGEIDGISRVSSVPEPMSLIALGVGLVYLARRRRNR